MGHRPGPDESTLEITVNLSGRLRRRRATMDRPGPRLFRTGSAKRLEIEQLVRGPNEDVQSRLGHTHVMEKLTPLCQRKLRDLRFQLSADDHHLSTLLPGNGPDLLHVLRFRAQVRFGNV